MAPSHTMSSSSPIRSTSLNVTSRNSLKSMISIRLFLIARTHLPPTFTSPFPARLDLPSYSALSLPIAFLTRCASASHTTRFGADFPLCSLFVTKCTYSTAWPRTWFHSRLSCRAGGLQEPGRVQISPKPQVALTQWRHSSCKLIKQKTRACTYYYYYMHCGPRIDATKSHPCVLDLKYRITRNIITSRLATMQRSQHLQLQQHSGLREQAVPKGVREWLIERCCHRQEGLREATLLFDVAAAGAVVVAAMVRNAVGVVAGDAVPVVAVVVVVIAAAAAFAGLGEVDVGVVEVVIQRRGYHVARVTSMIWICCVVMASGMRGQILWGNDRTVSPGVHPTLVRTW